jgi:hypothetical protein
VATGKVTKIADLPPFRVGDVFPANQKTAALVRFLVATQPLVSVSRLLTAKNAGPELDRVDGEQMLLATTADAKEAMDAFRDADAKGCLASVEANATDEVRKRLRRLRRHCDKTSKRSLYTLMIEPARNSAGGHWNRQRVLEELEIVKDEKVAVWIGDKTDGSASTGFNPLAHGLALRMSGIFNVSRQKQLRRVKLLSKLQGDLYHVASTAYTLALREAYARNKWT